MNSRTPLPIIAAATIVVSAGRAPRPATSAGDDGAGRQIIAEAGRQFSAAYVAGDTATADRYLIVWVRDADGVWHRPPAD